MTHEQVIANEIMQKYQTGFNAYVNRKKSEGQTDLKKLSIRFYSAVRSKFSDSDYCPFPCYLVDGYKKSKI